MKENPDGFYMPKAVRPHTPYLSARFIRRKKAKKTANNNAENAKKNTQNKN